MTTSKGYPENRERPNAIRVMTNDKEKQALVRAAKKAKQPLSTFIRKTALEAALAHLDERMAAIKKAKR